MHPRFMKGSAFAFAGGSALLFACAVHDDTTFPNSPQPTESPPIRTVIFDSGVATLDDGGEGQAATGGEGGGVDPGGTTNIAAGITSISTGQYHGCAAVNGGVQCRGSNLNGELGDGTNTERHVPVQVLGLPLGVVAVAAGESHTCALVRSGVQCWGSSGQLGNNSTTDSLVPVAVSGLTSDVSAITAGKDHTCALVKSGVQCWGSNYWGQLGPDAPTYFVQVGNNGSNSPATDGLVPVAVSGLTGLTSKVTAVVAGCFYTCALVNGGVQCWGSNGNGELGDGTTTRASSVTTPGHTGTFRLRCQA